MQKIKIHSGIKAFRRKNQAKIATYKYVLGEDWVWIPEMNRMHVIEAMNKARRKK